MLAIATVQSTAFAGSFMGTAKVQPNMIARFGAKTPKESNEFAYGLPGNVGFLPVSGNPNFDPLGFTKGKSKDEVYRLREAELAHSRVAMLASAGFLVQEKFHPLFSGDGGPAIEQIPALPAWVWGVMLIGITGCEIQRIAVGFAPLDKDTKKAPSALKPTYIPGDLGFDPLSLKPEDPAELREMQEKELAHARLGMIAAAGFLAQEAVTKATWGTAYGLPDF